MKMWKVFKLSILLKLMVCVPVFTEAQKNEGIRFESGLSWEQLKAKAKAENKYIFIDCYATWCAPCKAMDKQVYSNDTIAKAISHRFISIKVQMDTSKQDALEVQQWYGIANRLRMEYNVNAYPTYLFVSPDGEIVHKDIGYKNMKKFLELVNDATASEKQFYTLLKKYKAGNLNYDLMPFLARTARQLSDSIALTVAIDYMHKYLDTLNDDAFCSKQNIVFINEFIKGVTEKDRFFKICMQQSEKIDIVIGKGMAANLYENIISNQDIFRYAPDADKANSDLPWDSIKKNIREKFASQIADKVVTNARIRWYGYNTRKKKIWPDRYVNAVVEKVERYGIDTTDLFNFGNILEYSILRYSNDKKLLDKAIDWMEIVLRNYPEYGYFYPYAGLLYKSGRVTEALKWQSLVLQQIEYQAYKGNRDLKEDEDYKEQLEIFEKMKKGETGDKIWFQK